MASRLQLQTILETILGTQNEPEDKKRVYYQPPSNTKMQYPCIVYQRQSGDTQFADNRPYIITKRYQVTVIDRNPDSTIPDQVAELQMCTFDRDYTADNLNHFVYNLYF